MTKLTIGKLAKQVGMGVETLRYYERRGLIEPYQRTASGYRLYDAGAQRQLRFIRRAQALGFSLNEVAELLALSGDPDASAADIKAMTKEKIEDVEARIADLQRMRSALSELECRCPGEAGMRSECPILAALNDEEKPQSAVQST